MTAAASGGRAVGSLTRVTIIGPRHRVDLVLPSNEPIGVLLPDIVTMAGYESNGHLPEYQVSLLDGRVLDPSTCLRRAGVADGTLMRVDPLTDAPPAPIVHDVSDEVADDLDRRRGRWNVSARRWTATAVVAMAMVVATTAALAAVSPVVLAAAGLGILLVGSVHASMGARQVGVGTLVGGAMIMMAAISSWPADWAERGALWAAGGGVTLLALGFAGNQQRAALLGGCTVLLLDGLWVGLSALELPVERTASVVAVLSVGALGLLPRIAIMSSGLARLDDRQSNDSVVSRVAAEAAVSSAHGGLALACIAVAGSGALAGWLLAQAGTGWTTMLACLLAVALFLRLRAFPLTVEVVSLVAAALVVGAGLIDRWIQVDPGQWWVAAGLAVGVALAALALLGVEPQPHIRARARQLADGLEGLTVMALVPVATGVFAVYSRLLDTL